MRPMALNMIIAFVDDYDRMIKKFLPGSYKGFATPLAHVPPFAMLGGTDLASPPTSSGPQKAADAKYEG